MTVMLVQNYGVAVLWRNSIKAEANFPGVFSAEKSGGVDPSRKGALQTGRETAGEEVTGRRGSETEGRLPRGR